MSEQQLKITLVRSLIGNTERQRSTARSLGLRKMHQTVVQPDRPEIRGMVQRIEHLVQVEQIAAEAATEGAE
ncbi:MAG TPA: 50S ribosomal protein L30 [Armatimonadota bacterium]|nr:50S ribosomal protein L30 [Armatimonadota bacterium]